MGGQLCRQGAIQKQVLRAPDSDMFDRYYPEAESRETLSMKGFAKHVSDHNGTLVSFELMQLVMGAIVKCLKEMMSQGQPVKLDGLGTIRPTVTAAPALTAATPVAAARLEAVVPTAALSRVKVISRAKL